MANLQSESTGSSLSVSLCAVLSTLIYVSGSKCGLRDRLLIDRWSALNSHCLPNAPFVLCTMN